MSDTSSTGATYVLFRLGSEVYGLPVSAVTGVVRFKAPTLVPRASESVLGVINLRGRVLPVVDVGRRFSGTRFEETATSRIVVIEDEHGTAGIAVDQASEVVTFQADAVRPVPESVLSAQTARVFAGMVERPGGLVVLLDPTALMPQPEDHAFAVGTPDARKEDGDDV